MHLTVELRAHHAQPAAGPAPRRRRRRLPAPRTRRRRAQRPARATARPASRSSQVAARPARGSRAAGTGRAHAAGSSTQASRSAYVRLPQATARHRSDAVAQVCGPTDAAERESGVRAPHGRTARVTSSGPPTDLLVVPSRQTRSAAPERQVRRVVDPVEGELGRIGPGAQHGDGLAQQVASRPSKAAASRASGRGRAPGVHLTRLARPARSPRCRAPTLELDLDALDRDRGGRGVEARATPGTPTPSSGTACS